MRFAPFLASLLALAISAAAQEQDRKLMDRIFKPNTDGGVAEQNKAFSGGKSFSANQARVKEFHFTERFRARDYATTSYAGAKNWSGDFKYVTKSADTRGRGASVESVKTFATKSVPVKEARNSNKRYETASYESREYLIPGKSQKLLDQKYVNKKEMTMDEVRELLNKSK